MRSLRQRALAAAVLIGLLTGPALAAHAPSSPEAQMVPPSAPKASARQAMSPRQPALADLDARLQRLVTNLFLSYERRSTTGFRTFIASDFRGVDDLGFGHSAGQLALSIAGDFRNLRGVSFDVVASPPEYSADGKQARVDVQWSRRARFAVTGEEWIVRNQRTTLQFDLGGRRALLRSIDGHPAFGLTNPMGVLVVDRGSIDGQDVTGLQSVLNGRLGAGTQDVFGFGTPRRNQSAGSPNLSVSNVSVSPDPPSVSANGGRFSVTVTVHNGGVIASPAFQVQVSATSNAPQIRMQSGLIPGASAFVTFSGFTTPGPPLITLIVITATVDPANLVPDSDRTNNSMTIRRLAAP